MRCLLTPSTEHIITPLIVSQMVTRPFFSVFFVFCFSVSFFTKCKQINRFCMCGLTAETACVS